MEWNDMAMEMLPWLETDWVLSQFAKRLKTCRHRYEAFVCAGKEEGYRQEFHHDGEDGRVLADDRFLKELGGPSGNRMASKTRSVIGWLSRRLKASSIKNVAIYFQREPSAFSRHFGKMDTKAKSLDRLRDKLGAYINAITHACPHFRCMHFN